MNHVMVDLETLATTCDAAIISIGAVKFDLSGGTISDEGFYASVSLESNLDYHRRVSEDTLKWWLMQAKDNPDSTKVFHEPKQGIDEALERFAAWIGRPDLNIWSNGANFDEPILSHAYTQCQQPIPWKFWNVRCVRTFKNLPGAKDIVVPRPGTHHNALSDSLHQAALVQAIYAKLFMKIAKRLSE